MRLEEESRGEHSIVRVIGSAKQGANADALSDALLRAETSRTGCVIVDAAGITVLDSTALGVLVEAMRRLHASGREIVLVNPDRRVRLLLELTKLSGLFPTQPTIEAAIAAAGRHPKGEPPLGDRNHRDL